MYHMREVGKNHHQALWIEALDAKFEGRGEPFNREKFDQILGSYEVRPRPYSTDLAKLPHVLIRTPPSRP